MHFPLKMYGSPLEAINSLYILSQTINNLPTSGYMLGMYTKLYALKLSSQHAIILQTI